MELSILISNEALKNNWIWFHFNRCFWSTVSYKRLCWENMQKANIVQSNLDISNSDISNSAKRLSESTNTFWLLSPVEIGVWYFFTSPNYPKCRLICTSDNLNLKKKVPTTSRYWELTVFNNLAVWCDNCLNFWTSFSKKKSVQ